jgi:hypothetical protein
MRWTAELVTEEATWAAVDPLQPLIFPATLGRVYFTIMITISVVMSSGNECHSGKLSFR